LLKFTDGSKQNNHTATAVLLNSQSITKTLLNSASVYTSKLHSVPKKTEPPNSWR